MVFWPNDYEGAWTLSNSVKRKGVCLHTGYESEVRLFPSDLPGFYVSWREANEPPLLLKPDQVRESNLCTTLEVGGRRLTTVEHLLAALSGCGLTHVHMEVTTDEIPLLDGSAHGWVEAIEEVGIRPASSPRIDQLKLDKPLAINKGDSMIVATPAEKFCLIGIIDFPYEAIGQQMFSIELTPQSFVKEIAPARTFGFVDQLDQLKKAGLIKGGSIENALVCNGDSWMNPPLRFEDEPVRHKLLDLIGDLALVGFPKAQVLVYKGSHSLHGEFANELLKACSQNY